MLFEEYGWDIFIRDKSLNRVGLITNFEKATFVPRFNEVGTWAITLPAGTEIDRLLQFAGSGGRIGLEALRGGTGIVAGPMDTSRRTSNNEVDNRTISGWSDERYLRDRLAFPAPLQGYPHDSQAYDVRTGPAETVLKDYVKFNLGSSALTPRRLDGLVIPVSAAIGASVTGRARFDNLLTLLQNLAIAGGDVGFRMVQVGATIEFQVYQPEDKTALAVYSYELGTLEAFEYEARAATGNYAIAGGSGEGTLRSFRELQDPASILDYGRIETFVDASGTADPTELYQNASEELTKQAERSQLEFNPLETEGLQFIRDWNLGDKVTGQIDGVSFPQIIREIEIKLDEDKGETITPVVGGPEATRTPLMFKNASKAQTRLAQLERK